MKSMSGFGGGVASLSMKSAGAGGGGGIVTNNLVLHLDAGDSNSYSGSGTTWTDLSGQGNHATLINNPTYSSNNEGYLNFDGSNDYATLPNMDLTGNEATFSIWTYCTTTAQSAALIFLGDSTAPHGNGRILNVHLPYEVTGGQYYFDKGHDGSSSASYDRINGYLSSSLYLNQWVNWAFTANAATGSMKVYRNGLLFDSGTGKTKTFSNSDGDMKYIAYSGTNHYEGHISNLQIYKKELSQAEVTQNFNAMASRFGLGEIVTNNLVLHLDAGNSSSYSGSGTTWTDLTGNGNNGTLVNGVSYNSSDGGYLSFDGSNDRVDFSTYVQPAYTSSSSFTWFIWVYPTTYSNNDVIMGNRVVSGSNVWTKLTPSRFEWKYPNHLDGSGTDVTQNQWQNICIVKNGSSFTYYKNGTSIDTMTSTASKNYTNPFYLGGDPSYGENPACRISIVAVYDSALTASQVQQNFDATKGRYGL